MGWDGMGWDGSSHFSDAVGVGHVKYLSVNEGSY